MFKRVWSGVSLCMLSRLVIDFFFQAEDGIRDLVRSRGLGDVYKGQGMRGRERLATLAPRIRWRRRREALESDFRGG